MSVRDFSNKDSGVALVGELGVREATGRRRSPDVADILSGAPATSQLPPQDPRTNKARHAHIHNFNLQKIASTTNIKQKLKGKEQRCKISQKLGHTGSHT
jgi:hypothetical protein